MTAVDRCGAAGMTTDPYQARSRVLFVCVEKQCGRGKMESKDAGAYGPWGVSDR
jgi:hypothetical protein